MLHRAICGQVYDCLFNSAHLAKKILNLDGAFSHSKFLCQLPVLGFMSDLIFACKYEYPIEANTHTTKQKAQVTHKQQQSNTECIHMYLLLCEMQHFDASWN